MIEKNLKAFVPSILWMTLSVVPASAQDAPPYPAGPGGVIQTIVAGDQDPAEAPVRADLIRKAREAGWPENRIEAVLALIDRLESDDLPSLTVLDRARQGIVKKATPERVLQVLEAMVPRIRLAGLLVDERFPADSGDRVGPDHERLELIDRASFAIEKGVPRASLQTLFGSIHETGQVAQLNALDAPVITLASVTSAGVDNDQGVDLVVKAHEKGVRGKELENLGLQISEAIHSVPPQERREVIRQILEGLDRNVPPGEIIRGLNRRGHRHPPGLDRPPGQRGGFRPPDDPARRGRGQTPPPGGDIRP